MSLTSTLSAVAPPFAAIAAATACGQLLEDYGAPKVGMEHITGGLLAYLIIKEVLKDRRDRRAAKEPDERLQVQREIAKHMAESTALLREMRDDQKEIGKVTGQYQAQGGCPWLDADKSRGLIRDMGAEARRPRHGG